MADNQSPINQQGDDSWLKKILLYGVLPFLFLTVVLMLTFYIIDEKERSVSSGFAQQSDESVLEPAIYLPLDPPFLVNFDGQGRARYLQISMNVMARNQTVIEQVEHHMPIIRNTLVLLFSGQSLENVNTLEGKENLREKVLYAIQDILKDETGSPGIEAVYFTNFVIQ